MIRKPPRLNPGDVVGIVAPSSPPKDPAVIDQCVKTVERLGFTPKLGDNVRNRQGFLAGTDEERAADLMAMFTDPEVKAVFCVRGGYGCSRLLPLLDFQTIARHPKIFLGYSDITCLHLAILKKCGFTTFHGPTIDATLIAQNNDSYPAQMLMKALTDTSPIGSIVEPLENRERIEVLHGGKATGHLIGGTLSILCAAVGTPYLPSFNDGILFLEEVGEPLYRIDRALTHLLNTCLLDKIKGVAIGICRDCRDMSESPSGEYRQTLKEVFAERLKSLKVPVVMGLPFGHIAHHATLPMGVPATLNAESGDLIVEEAAVI